MEKKQPGTKLNYIESITLEYLADNYSNERNVKTSETISVEDLKFYRKRLTNMFKEKVVELINNNGINTNLTSAFNTLVFSIVKEGIKDLKHQDWMELQNNEIGDVSNGDSEIQNVENVFAVL